MQPLTLSADYEKNFDNVLQFASTCKIRGRVQSYTLCWPEVGGRYPRARSLLVIGRATNGFDQKVEFSSLGDPVQRKAVVTEARERAEKEPLRWVVGAQSETPASNSPFWRVTRQVLNHLEPDAVTDPVWVERLAWSNLSKIAPRESGNPSWRLFESQFPAGSAALKTELEELRPRVALIIAGAGWHQPLVDALQVPLSAASESLTSVTHTAKYEDTLLVFTKRPERKPEAPYIKEVCEIIDQQLG